LPTSGGSDVTSDAAVLRWPCDGASVTSPTREMPSNSGKRRPPGKKRQQDNDILRQLARKINDRILGNDADEADDADEETDVE